MGRWAIEYSAQRTVRTDSPQANSTVYTNFLRDQDSNACLRASRVQESSPVVFGRGGGFHGRRGRPPQQTRIGPSEDHTSKTGSIFSPGRTIDA